MNRPPTSKPTPIAPRDVTALRQWGHDARTIATGITDNLRLIRQEGMDPASRLHLESAIRHGMAISRVIAKALAQMAGEPEPEYALDLADMRREFLLAYEEPARQSGAELRISLDPGLPACPGVDKVGLERIFANLLGNAIHHSGAQTIEIAFAAPDPDWLTLTVRDDGTGFPAEVLAAPRGGEGDPAGQGLGLAIVGAVVDELGGRWNFANADDAGAIVRVELPCGRREAPQPLPSPGEAPGRIAGHRVLAADDNQGTLKLISRLLGAQGAEVESFSTGAEAVAALNRRLYDLIVVDANMPGISGAAVIRALRARPGRAGQTPALALTADHSMPCYEELITAGADRVLLKPIADPSEVPRIAARMIHAPYRAGADASARPASATPGPPPAADDPPLPIFDPEPLLRVCALAGPEMSREIVERLIADLLETESRLARASTPLDIEELRAASHVLIAIAGTAGATRLVARSQALNRLLHGTRDADLAPLLAEVKQLTAGAIAAMRRFPPTGATGTSAQ